jgi:nitrate/nitrite transporter NarK
MILQGSIGANFVLAHRSVVTLYVGRQDGSKFALDAVIGHIGTLI